MYIPKNSMLNPDREGTVRRRKQKSPIRKPNSVAIVSVVLLFLLFAALVLNKNENPPTPKMYAHDLEKLWSWSDSIMAGGAASAKWTLRFDAVLGEERQLEELSDVLFSNGDGRIMTERIVTNGGDSVSGRFPEPLGQGEAKGLLSLHQTRQQGKGTGVILLLEAEVGDATEQGLQAALKQVGGFLSEWTQDWTLTMKTHGYSEKTGGAKKLERIALGRVLEQYADEGTLSVTMLSDGLLSSKGLDDDRVANLQVAEHRSTETGREELTIGVPLITGDFSSVRLNEGDAE